MVYATSLHIIPHITQKKNFTYKLPKDLVYKSKKVSAIPMRTKYFNDTPDIYYYYYAKNHSKQFQ